MAAPVIVTVPALVSTFSNVTAPVMFITPPLATVKGPATVPLAQVNVPVTVLVLISVAPLSVRLVIPPLFWKAGPKTTLPPASTRLVGTFWVSVSVPPVNSQSPEPLMTGGTPMVKLPPAK